MGCDAVGPGIIFCLYLYFPFNVMKDAGPSKAMVNRCRTAQRRGF